jgi:hypothetical protein
MRGGISAHTATIVHLDLAEAVARWSGVRTAGESTVSAEQAGS